MSGDGEVVLRGYRSQAPISTFQFAQFAGFYAANSDQNGSRMQPALAVERSKEREFLQFRNPRLAGK